VPEQQYVRTASLLEVRTACSTQWREEVTRLFSKSDLQKVKRISIDFSFWIPGVKIILWRQTLLLNEIPAAIADSNNIQLLELDFTCAVCYSCCCDRSLGLWWEVALMHVKHVHILGLKSKKKETTIVNDICKRLGVSSERLKARCTIEFGVSTKW
jgi:hypothetical protein